MMKQLEDQQKLTDVIAIIHAYFENDGETEPAVADAHDFLTRIAQVLEVPVLRCRRCTARRELVDGLCPYCIVRRERIQVEELKRR